MTHWTILLAATEGGLFDLDATLPLMAIQFLILVALLNAVLYKPLGNAIDERVDYVRTELSKAKESKDKAINTAKEYEQKLKEVRRQSQEVIANATSEAQKIMATQIQQAQQEVLLERQKAAQEIETQKASAFESLQQQVDALSHQIVEKLLLVK